MFYTGLFPIVNTVGLFSNILCFLVLRREKKDATRTLLLGLTVADINMNILGLYSCGVHIAMYYYPRQGGLALYYNNGIGFIAMYGWMRTIDNWLTTTIAIQRAIAVTFPLYLRTNCRIKSIYIICTFIVVVSFLLSFPYLFAHETRTRSTGNGTSETYYVLGPVGRNKQLFSIFTIITEVVLFTLAPIIVTLVSSIIIISQLRRKTSTSNTITDDNKLRRDEQSRVITKTLMVIGFVFVVCITPFSLIRALKVIATGGTGFPNNVFSLLSVICLFIESFSTSANLYIYIFFSAKYRASFFQLWSRSSQKSKRENSSVRQSLDSFEISSGLTT